MESSTGISKTDRSILRMILNPNLPFDNEEEVNSTPADADNSFDPEKLSKVKELEKKGVELAEAKEISKSLEMFDQAIAILPQRASAYNNRAQARRFNHDNEGALQDLDVAISLTNETGKIAGLAFAQRSLIMKLQGDNEACERDLKRAAELGNNFAKQEMVQNNPYAALCNQMLTQAMKNLQDGKTN